MTDTPTPTAADLHRAAGIEKMARAIAQTLGTNPDLYAGTQRLVGNPKLAAKAALAAWEAHEAEKPRRLNRGFL